MTGHIKAACDTLLMGLQQMEGPRFIFFFLKPWLGNEGFYLLELQSAFAGQFRKG